MWFFFLYFCTPPIVIICLLLSLVRCAAHNDFAQFKRSGEDLDSAQQSLLFSDLFKDFLSYRNHVVRDPSSLVLINVMFIITITILWGRQDERGKDGGVGNKNDSCRYVASTTTKYHKIIIRSSSLLMPLLLTIIINITFGDRITNSDKFPKKYCSRLNIESFLGFSAVSMIRS